VGPETGLDVLKNGKVCCPLLSARKHGRCTSPVASAVFARDRKRRRRRRRWRE
jgi:hypothetical protein